MIRIGLNTTAQNTVASVPKNFLIENLEVDSFVGKRYIEVNAGNGIIRKCQILGVYHPDNQDSQAICILNSTGGIEVSDCHLQAASENIMVGGDTMKIPGIRPTGFRFLRNFLEKPLHWKAEGKPVKNLFELKDGHDVLIEDMVGLNCWAGGQPGGYCFMFTPANGASLRNIRVVNADVANVGGIVNITGTDASGKNKERTQVRFDGGIYRTNKAQMGGRGDFALLGRGPEFLDVFGCDIQIDGNTFIYVGDDKIVDRIQVENCKFNTGKYGININGEMNGLNTKGIVKQLIVRGNTISGASTVFKKNFPDNTYV
jgi:hypothetical protein